MNAERLKSLLRASDPAFLQFGRAGSVAFLAVGCLLIGAWQGVYVESAWDLDRSYARKGKGFYPGPP